MAMLFVACATNTKVKVIQTGKYRCTNEQNYQSAKKKVDYPYCETSAVAYDGKRLFIANDKKVNDPKKSSLFSFELEKIVSNKALQFDFKNKIHHLAFPIKNSVKFEDATVTPDGKYIIFITGFDRIRDTNFKWDPYNSIVYWPTGHPDKAKFALPTSLAEVKKKKYLSSRGFRDDLKNALRRNDFPEGPSYYNVEGITTIPGNKLLLGIRKVGDHWMKFSYKTIFLIADYSIDDNSMEIKNLKMLQDHSSWTKEKTKFDVAISSLEYNPDNKKVYFLTSYEVGIDGEEIGSHLWEISLEDLMNDKKPNLVFDESGRPLNFYNKAEGISYLGDGYMIIIHDDDRVLKYRDEKLHRKPNEAFFHIIKLQN